MRADPVTIDTNRYYNELDKAERREMLIAQRASEIERGFLADIEKVAEVGGDILWIRRASRSNLESINPVKALMARDYIAFGEFLRKRILEEIAKEANQQATDEYDKLFQEAA